MWRVAFLRWGHDLQLSGHKFILRPGNNVGGLIRLCTLDVMIWFFNTVRNNIGYSIALAIYGPFTFYFITQPLNPKAMWAVGEVRQSYLSIMENFKRGWNQVHTPNSINTGAAAATYNVPQINTALPQPLSAPDTNAPFTFASWQDRMSNFKGLQIALEENMVFAARMGRIEQIESQLLFPLTARGAWTESTLYLNAIASLRKNANATQHDSLNLFLDHEFERTKHAQLYILSKLKRFLGDHYYIVLDAANDHAYRNRYMGDALFLFLEMTQDMESGLSDDQKSTDTQGLLLLAQKFAPMQRKNRSAHSEDILTRISTEAPALANPEKLDDWAYRAPLLRQWEILFLLQNRAQEASNYGRMAYTESVRTTLFALQTFTAAKRYEIETLFSENAKAHYHQRTRLSESLLENAYHLMFADLASLAPELHTRLPNDSEYEQRLVLISELRDTLRERDALISSWK